VMDGGPDGGIDRRCPVPMIAADGSPALAFLERSPGRGEVYWRLRVAPLDVSDGGPEAREAGARELGRGCLPVPPTFSGDGRWVTSLVPAPQRPYLGQLRRTAVDGPPDGGAGE
jgi:hypothetical protein